MTKKAELGKEHREEMGGINEKTNVVKHKRDKQSCSTVSHLA